MTRCGTAFGRVFKEGIYEDPERRDQLLGLVAVYHHGRRLPLAQAICRPI